MPTFRHDWFTRNIPHLTEWLRGKRFAAGLEIGSFEGRSAIWWLENICDHLTCVDRWEGDWYGQGDGILQGAEQLFDANLSGFAGLCKRKGESKNVLAEMMLARQAFDFIYVDGDHEAPSALTDAVLSWQLLPSGGYAIFDDYGWTQAGIKIPPKIGIDAFLSCFSKACARVELSPIISYAGIDIQQVLCVKK